MDFEYMKALRHVANEVKPDFWLMGEVIHGNYSRWANDETLHSVTNYMLHKALYSGHNDHNYFEVAHTIKYVNDMVGGKLKLYSFVDNHDVERIYTKLNEKAHFWPVHVMLYTLPGIPSLYYGSEFGIEGRKEKFSDDSLRPALNLEDYKDAAETNPCTKLIAALGKIRQNTPALCYGDYKELQLQTTHFAYARTLGGKAVIVTVNNAGNDVHMDLQADGCGDYVGALTGERVAVNGGRISVRVGANSGEIWIPAELSGESFAPIKTVEIAKAEPANEVVERAEAGSAPIIKEAPKAEEQVVQPVRESADSLVTPVAEPTEAVTETAPLPEEEKIVPEEVTVDWNKPYEEMSVEELQEAILEEMRRNGPVTDYMLGTVRENTHHGSLVNWVKSFG